MTTKNNTLWTRGFILVTLVNLFLFLANQILLPTAPLHARSLGASDEVIGLMVGAFTVSSVLMRYLAGLGADRWGRRLVLWIGIITMAAATALSAYLPAIGAFFLLRTLLGAGWGISSTASATIATDLIPSSRFGVGMNYFSLSTSLAIATGPVVGIALYNGRGAPTLFMGALLLLAIASATALPLQSSHNKVSTPRQEASISFSAWNTIRPSITMFIVCIGYGAVTSFLPLFAAQRGIANIGTYFTVYALCMVVLRPWFGHLADKHGYGRILYPGIVLLGAGLLVLATTATFQGFMVSALFYGIGFSAVQATLQTQSAIHVPIARLGWANAIFFMLFDGGMGIGAVIAGVLSTAMGYEGMFLVMAAALIPSALFHVLSEKRKRA